MENIHFDYDLEPSRDILCIDCKSFYASTECVLRGFDPLTTELVVMSYPSDRIEQRGSGLILAASPAAKKAYGIRNVSRARDLPFPYPKSLKIVPPRMKLYLKMNQRINRIYKTYCDEDNHHVYSIDESFLDVTNALGLFQVESPYELARLIQQDVFHQTGIYTTVGIGDNPLLAKLALDNAAKKSSDMKAEWRYKDVPKTIWRIPQLTDFWGIGGRMAKRLHNMGIRSVDQLAHSNYFYLKDRLGVIGGQLYAHAWGIDRTFLGQSYQPKSRSLGNQQILPRDYEKKEEVAIVVKEMADQIGTRLRQAGLETEGLTLHLGFSKDYRPIEGKTYVRRHLTLPRTQQTKALMEAAMLLFQLIYKGQVIRSVGLTADHLSQEGEGQLDLFTPVEKLERGKRLDETVDRIRHRFGFQKLLYAHSMMEGGRAIARSSLVGGHAGGLGGLEEGIEARRKNDKNWKNFYRL